MRSDACAHQAFALDNCLDVQFHVAVTASMVRAWARGGGEEIRDAIAAGDRSVRNPRTMLDRLEERVAAHHRFADALYGAWLGRER